MGKIEELKARACSAAWVIPIEGSRVSVNVCYAKPDNKWTVWTNGSMQSSIFAEEADAWDYAEAILEKLTKDMAERLKKS